MDEMMQVMAHNPEVVIVGIVVGFGIAKMTGRRRRGGMMM